MLEVVTLNTRKAPVKSPPSTHHHRNTNTEVFTGWMPFLPTNSVKAPKGKHSNEKQHNIKAAAVAHQLRHWTFTWFEFRCHPCESLVTSDQNCSRAPQVPFYMLARPKLSEDGHQKVST